MFRSVILSIALVVSASAAQAEFAKIVSMQDFVRAVKDKTLTRPLIRLQVLPDGRIEGRGMMRDVSGKWSWKDGYFCRDLFWGTEDLGYNCQVVHINAQSIRFTADRGVGDYADFSLK